MSRFWTAPKYWVNDTVVIVGGGPSLKNFDLTGIEKFKSIAVNSAFKLVPNADILFYADTRWWRWNSADIKKVFGTGRIVSTSSCAAAFLDPSVVRMGRDYRYQDQDEPLSTTPGYLSGSDSGYMAINLAVQMGASRIILLGFDMQFQGDETHWHPDHPITSQITDYVDRFAPTYPRLVQALHKRGIEIIRCTPSALHMIPEIPWEDALKLKPRLAGPGFLTI